MTLRRNLSVTLILRSSLTQGLKPNLTLNLTLTLTLSPNPIPNPNPHPNPNPNPHVQVPLGAGVIAAAVHTLTKLSFGMVASGLGVGLFRVSCPRVGGTWSIRVRVRVPPYCNLTEMPYITLYCPSM